MMRVEEVEAFRSLFQKMLEISSKYLTGKDLDIQKDWANFLNFQETEDLLDVVTDLDHELEMQIKNAVEYQEFFAIWGTAGSTVDDKNIRSRIINYLSGEIISIAGHAHIGGKSFSEFSDKVLASFTKIKFYDVFESSVMFPLFYFNTESDNIELNEKLRIHRLSKDEMEKIKELRSGVHDRFGYVLEIAKDFYCLDQYYDRSEDMMEYIITALRLIKNEEVHFRPKHKLLHFKIIRDAEGFHSTSSYSGGIVFTGESLGYPVLYDLKKSEVEHFITMTNLVGSYQEKIKNKKTLQGVNSALTRFNSSFEAKGRVDEFIDLWIGLETISRRGGVELAYRIANLVGTSSEEKQEIFETLKMQYKMRNDILHGSSIKDHDIEPNKKLRNFLRRSIIKVLEIANSNPEKDIEDIVEFNFD